LPSQILLGPSFCGQACRAQSLVGDDEIVTRILSEESANPSARALLLSACVAHRRVGVLDRTLPVLHSRRFPIVRWLHGASSETVASLLHHVTQDLSR
jgi:hypothetical protein